MTKPRMLIGCHIKYFCDTFFYGLYIYFLKEVLKNYFDNFLKNFMFFLLLYLFMMMMQIVTTVIVMVMMPIIIKTIIIITTIRFV